MKRTTCGLPTIQELAPSARIEMPDTGAFPEPIFNVPITRVLFNINVVANPPAFAMSFGLDPKLVARPVDRDSPGAHSSSIPGPATFRFNTQFSSKSYSNEELKFS
jgi:hypothetical protein